MGVYVPHPVLTEDNVLKYGRIKTSLSFPFGPLPEGFSITTLTTPLPYFTGFQGWLTLSLIVCVFGICQRVAPQVLDAIVDSFWVTIEFEEDDHSYRECLLVTPAVQLRLVTSTIAFVMPPLPSAEALTTHCPRRLDDFMAFTTPNDDKGEEACNQYPIPRAQENGLGD